MDLYFLIETAAPLILGIVFYRFTVYVLKSATKTPAVIKILLSLCMLVAMVAAFFLTARHFNQVRCEAAYGPLAAAPEMCDNPANGMLMLFIQMPVILAFWIYLSVLIALKPTGLKASA